MSDGTLHTSDGLLDDSGRSREAEGMDGRFGLTHHRIEEFRTSQEEAALGRARNAGLIPEAVVFSKPELEQQSSGGILKTLLSLLLFIAAFYLIVPDPMIVAFVVIVLFVHEAGHLLAMKAYGYRDLRMIFVPLFGALALGNKESVTQSERAVILMAGPVPGILIGLPLIVFGPAAPFDFAMLGVVFVILNLFNLLPITPLDGGRLMETLFFSRSAWLKRGFLLLSALGMIAVVFITRDWYLAILPLLILSRLPMEFSTDKLRKVISQNPGWADRSYESLSDTEYTALRPLVLESMSEKMAAQLEKRPGLSSERNIAMRLQAALVPPLRLDMGNGARAITTILWLLFLTLPFVVMLMSMLPRILR